MGHGLVRFHLTGGVYAPGVWLPSERELAEEYQVDRSTVRRAMRILAERDLVTLVTGTGAQVRVPSPSIRRTADDVTRQVGTWRGFHVSAASTGQQAFTETTVSEVETDLMVGRGLGVPTGTLLLRRARQQGIVGGPPVQLSTSYIRLDLVNKLPILREVNTGSGGMYSRMEELGYRIHFEESVACRLPNDEEQEKLEIDLASQCLCSGAGVTTSAITSWTLPIGSLLAIGRSWSTGMTPQPESEPGDLTIQRLSSRIVDHNKWMQLHEDARLLDVIDNCSASALVKWMPQRNPTWRAGIGVAAPDPYRGYACALQASLPHATRVLDAFHVVRLGFAAVDQVRCRIQRETTGHRGRTSDPLYGIRRLLRRAPAHHTDRSWDRLLAGLDAGDNPRAGPAATIDSWRGELLAYFTTGGLSNGPTEAINLLIKKIKRIGHGFRNFDNYRLRLLLHCGIEWNTIPATLIRGRLPRSVAWSRTDSSDHRMALHRVSGDSWTACAARQVV